MALANQLRAQSGERKPFQSAAQKELVNVWNVGYEPAWWVGKRPRDEQCIHFRHEEISGIICLLHNLSTLEETTEGERLNFRLFTTTNNNVHIGCRGRSDSTRVWAKQADG